jgi:hypothetical protein
MDPEELRRDLLALGPCLAFHDIGPDTLASIRAAADPQSPTAVRWPECIRAQRDYPALEPPLLETPVRQRLREAEEQLMREYVLASLIYRLEVLRGSIET